ncbi:MAG: hypothetical protein CVT80_00950 [Alphaproteobacteria bacterium HGW-Alphaproteobacteria-2]|nr:MAG: hypothetical protein CVT80_00950 [Alphaproteobacteria bacterium HGW-Alphaproteobacteria-2]
MKLPDMPFTPLDWASVPATEYPGTNGSAFWRTVEHGTLRLRVVDYSPGYEADHWCDRGHVLHVLSGRMVIRLRDGRSVALAPGQGFCVSDHGDAAHLVVSDTGCRAFIVD